MAYNKLQRQPPHAMPPMPIMPMHGYIPRRPASGGKAPRRQLANQQRIRYDSESSDDEDGYPFDFSSGKGVLAETVNIYRSKKDVDGQWTYVSEPPEDVAEPAENEGTERAAIVVRNRKSMDSRRKMEADSIIGKYLILLWWCGFWCADILIIL